ncbi:MAG: T9SS type A sorting domain-containing protein [Ignavibacteriaceae bacterium]|nr:T9SS type A sorting domain-containing protein [Ignavibacteriaceae bacterium]
MKLNLFLFSVIVAVFIFANTLLAQTTYSPTRSGQWSTMVWNPSGTPSASDNVVIPDGDTVTINTNFAINNLTIGGGTSGILQFSKTDTTSIVVNGDILINAGGSFKAQTNLTGGSGLLHLLELHGNLTHNGAILDFRNGAAGSTLSCCNLTLAGSTNSTLTINGVYSSTNGDFNSITINKTEGAKVILGSNIYMNGGSSTGPAILNTVLTFISGIIETGPYVWICQNTTSANVTGYSSASYINGAMGRGMSNTAGANKDFPVGDSLGYRVFNLRSTTSGAGTGHYAEVRCIPGNANTGTSILTSDIDKVSSVRYYQVSFNHGPVSTPFMSFDRFIPSYGTDDGVAEGNTNLRVAISTDSLAHWIGLNQSKPDTTTLLAPPVKFTPDSLAVPDTLRSGVGSIYVALARVTGTTENSLDRITGINDKSVKPSSFELSQNYPNPFNPSTKINYSIAKKSFVTLKIYNILGKEMTTLINGEKDPGNYNITFNAGKLATGVYLYRLSTGDYSSVKKMILMK